MIETTRVGKPIDYTTKGYVDMGFFEKGNKTLEGLMMKATVQDKSDLVLLLLDDSGNVFQVFEKVK